MKNKTLSGLLFGSFGLALFAFVLGNESVSANLWALAGLGLWIFGLWAAARLWHTEDAPRHPAVHTEVK